MWTKLNKILRKKLQLITKHKRLVILTSFNLILLFSFVAFALANRQYLESYLLNQLLTRKQPPTSYQYKADIAPFNLELRGSYVRDTSQFKQLTLTWPYQESRDQLDLIYNIDNLYLTLNSQQLVDYLSDMSATQHSDPFMDNPFFKGVHSLHFDKTFLDHLNPQDPSDEEIKETLDFVNQQIFKSLGFAGFPKLTLIENHLLLKIPLKVEYEILNDIIYPNLKSYLVNNQTILKTILDQTKIDVYLNPAGQVIRLVFIIPPLTDDQIQTIFDDKNANTLVQLNEHIMNSLKNFDEHIVITTTFSNINEPFNIAPPTNVIDLETLFADLSFSPAKIAESTRTQQVSKYTINNAFQHIAPSDMIAKDFAMVHNMLYRYFNEHGRYPNSLDALANSYFPGLIPGNSETGQAFYYSTFDSNQGYLLCPTNDSDRAYCYKKFKLNEIN